MRSRRASGHDELSVLVILINITSVISCLLYRFLFVIIFFRFFVLRLLYVFETMLGHLILFIIVNITITVVSSMIITVAIMYYLPGHERPQGLRGEHRGL